jgi:WD40 repeat protein
MSQVVRCAGSNRESSRSKMKTRTRIHQTALALSALVVNLSFNLPAQADSWTNTGAMTWARAAHTATILSNGKVLVAGGSGNGSPALSNAELYDPAFGTWTYAGSFNGARNWHTATLLPNGKVLLAGGFDGSGDHLSSANLYDPATGTWSATGSLNAQRRDFTATLLPDGKVLAAGGGDSYGILSSAELYDPATGKWTMTGALKSAHSHHSAAFLHNGKVLVAGGAINKSAELYDPATGTWTTTGSMNVERYYFTATLLPDGKVLVTGGIDRVSNKLSSAELYDPEAGTWSVIAAMGTARGYHTATLLPNGNVLVAGGNSGAPAYGEELYDTATGTWTATASMVIPFRAAASATLLPDGNVLLAGGHNGNSLSQAELYLSGFIPPCRIAAQPQSQLGFWGKTVSFTVAATNGIPPYAYQWRKEGVDISSATNSVLTLTNVQPTDAGIYTVLVSDTVTNLLSQPATLTVNPAGVSIALYAGVTIDGVVGQTYGVQSTMDLSNTNSWVGRANVTLTNATQLWYDSQPATQPQTYYRVVPGPISTP